MLLSDLINADSRMRMPIVDIVGLAADSRQVRPGYLFAALAGKVVDGRNYISEAVGHGAVAVLAPPGTVISESEIPLITDENPRRRLAKMAARFFEMQPEIVVAVTGTNGKTSVVGFTEQIWRHLGYRAASLGTLGVHGDDLETPLAHTTPEPVTLHRTLAQIKKHGINHVAMEASSHGLDQYRLDGVHLKAAAFTNLSHDHLDYHTDIDSYFAAKARLFAEVLDPGGTAVLNADARNFASLAKICRARGQNIVTYGVAGKDIRIISLLPNGDGQELHLLVFGEHHQVQLPLCGDFQASNAVCALSLVLTAGAEAEQAVHALGRLQGSHGRLQKVGKLDNGAPVYVDYAHTPEALENLLRALKPHVRARLILIFGCGGDRDQSKRRIMGKVASLYADKIIVTDDNPRHENAATIRHQILGGCIDATEIGDRSVAIKEGISMLKAGDMLVIAGKGHEQGQIVGDETLPFNDIEQASTIVSARNGLVR